MPPFKKRCWICKNYRRDKREYCNFVKECKPEKSLYLKFEEK